MAKLLLLFFILILAPAKSFALSEQPAMPPALVSVVTVTHKTIAPEIDLPGSVISLNDAQLATKVSGIVNWVIQPGERVNKGDVLAQIDDTRIALNVKKNKALLAALNADLKFVNSELKRIEKLAQKDNASASLLQQTLTEKEKLEQNIHVAKANLALAQDELTHTKIKAPYAGIVAARYVAMGEYVSLSDKILRLVDNNNLEIAVAAPINIVPFLTEGDTVNVSKDASNDSAKIRSVIAVGDYTSRMVEVRLSIKANAWIIGESVTVTLPKGKSMTTLAIPRDAIVLRAGESYVFKVSEENKAIQTKVDIINAVGDWVAVNSEIKEQDKVIIRGAERLQPNQSVTF